MKSARKAPVLRFEDEGHRYTVDGRQVPSVTQVLNYFQHGFNHDENAANFGRAVHKACELDDLDDLDEAALDPLVGRYLEGYRRFRRDMRFVPDAGGIERKLYHPVLDVAGTLDRTGTIQRTAAWRILVDFKTGAPTRTAGPQTAGYETMLPFHGIEPVQRRYSLHLDEERYNLIPHAERSDASVFVSALTLFRWLNPKGLPK